MSRPLIEGPSKVSSVWGRRRNAVVRLLCAGSLMGAGAIVALQGPAGATGNNHLVLTNTLQATVASGTALSPQPQITLEDNSNVAVTGVTDTITATITGGVSVVNATANVNSSTGIATFSGLTLNALAGNYTITFTDTTPTITTGPTTSPTIAITAGTATRLVITTAPSSTANSGVALGTQPVVKAEDLAGNVSTSTSGTVTASSTNSPTVTISAGTSATLVNGVATFVGVTLNGAATTSTTLQFSGLTFTVTSATITMAASTATHLFVFTQPSTPVPSGVAFATQPVVQILDGSNAVVTADGSTVTATVTSSAGTVTNATAVAVNGVATFSGLAINALASTGYTLTFTDGSLTSAVSSAIQVTLGPAAKLKIATQPSSAVQSGSPLSQQPVVFIQDSGGNLETANTSTVTATLTAGSGTITNPSVAAAGGIATFSGLAINAPAGVYSLTFSDGGLTTAVSTNITVAAGVATKLVITTQPSTTAVSGVALAIQPVVKVEDSGGNVVTGSSSTVTAVSTPGTNTAVNNTAAVNTSNGTATFSGLALNAPVGTYTLTFTDGSLTPAVSTSITVTSGPATKLVITTQPSATDASGAALAVQPVVKVEDAAGNVVTTDTTTVTAKITTGGVSVTSPTAVAVAGVATFSGTALNALVGSYTLTFTDGTLTPAVSTSITVTTGAAAKLLASTEPSAKAASGVALAVQPVIKVVDSGGNLVTSVTTGNVTASVYSGAGGTVSAGATAAINAGVATFSGLAITGVSGNTYVLLFTGASLTLIDATQISLGTAQAALTVTPLKGYLGRSLTLTASGGSGTGALSFAVTNGTATGCKVTGSKLTYSSTGTCIVTATKAGDATYVSTSSAATTVTIVKLRIPGVVRVTFARNSSALSATGRHALIVLSGKLTSHSTVTFIGYARGNLRLAQLRAHAVAHYLWARVHVKIRYAYNRTSTLNAVRVITTAQ